MNQKQREEIVSLLKSDNEEDFELANNICHKMKWIVEDLDEIYNGKIRGKWEYDRRSKYKLNRRESLYYIIHQYFNERK